MNRGVADPNRTEAEPAGELRPPARPRRPRRQDRRTAETVEKILDAAIEVMLQRGAAKLSARDICEKAGISRTTLYRHFPSREELLKGVSLHIRALSDREVAAAVAGIDDPRARWRALVASQDSASPRGGRLLELEPAFMIDYLRGGFDHFRGRVLDALGPTFDAWDAQLGAPLNRDLIATLMIRYALSCMLAPEETPRQAVADELEKIVALLRQSGG